MGICNNCELFNRYGFDCEKIKLTNSNGTSPVDNNCKPKTYDDIHKNEFEEDEFLQTLKETGRELRVLLNITPDDIETALKEIRSEWK